MHDCITTTPVLDDIAGTVSMKTGVGLFVAQSIPTQYTRRVYSWYYSASITHTFRNSRTSAPKGIAVQTTLPGPRLPCISDVIHVSAQ